MKKLLALFSLGFAAAALLESPAAQAQPVAKWFSSNRLLPPNSLYLAPAQSSAMAPNGIILSNAVLRGFTQSMPAPPPGTSAALQFGLLVEFDLSVNGGGTFTHVSSPATATVNIRGIVNPGPPNIYDTELLQLTISGNLPGGVLIRESPTLPSFGQVALNPQPLPPGGGNLISSFFDLMLEASTDGGNTWAGIIPGPHVELRVDPGTIAGVPEPSPLFPPPDDQLVMREQDVATFAGGVRITGLRQTLSSVAVDASMIGVSPTATILPYIDTADFHLSLSAGQTFTIRASGNLSVALQKVRASPAHVFDTEMLQMDISGNFPNGSVMIRESPTLPSYGGTRVQAMGDGSFEVRSFFDVWPELSLDGGQTWQPANNGPIHLEVQGNSLRQRFATAELPPPNSRQASPAQHTYVYGTSGVVLATATVTFFTGSMPPPGPGQSQNQPVTGQMDGKISINGGQTFTSFSAPAAGTLRVSSSAITWGDANYYDTEMLSLNIAGGTLPGGLMIRESPTRASLGRSSTKPAGSFRIDSFFDIFTEVSTDGGQNWAIADGPISSALIPTTPAEAPLRIICPSNLTVFATSSSGAVVTFFPLALAGDCPLLPLATVTCSVPSGSVFPIGTTAVTCEAHNGCGEHVSCSFTVTVLPSLPQVVDHFFPRGLWPPFNGMYLSPAQFGSASAGGIIFSNITLGSFSRSDPPPSPGTSLTRGLGLMVELEWSLDGGATFMHGSAPAQMVVNLQDIGPGQIPGQEIHNMEILRLDISGGSFPSGLRIRESPTRPSVGQTGVQSLPDNGGYLISSFFDVNFEISMNGGVWMPMEVPQHLELRVDPMMLNPVPEFSPLSPPLDDQLMSSPEYSASFAGGVRIKNLRHKLFSSAFDATMLGVSSVPAVQRFTTMLDLQWSLNNGQTFTAGRAPAVITVAIQKCREAATHSFDTEMLQMDVPGGDLPPNVRLRESPTLASHGQMSLERLADGTFNVGSFFDLWPEFSTDGGQTWQPVLNGPLHLEVQGNSPRSHFTSQNLPPLNGQYESGRRTYQWGTTGILIASDTFARFSESFPPPQPGQPQARSFFGRMDVRLSTDGGQTFNTYITTASAQMSLAAGINWGDGQFYDTEMLQLDFQLNIPGLPPLMVRESPTRASPGRTAIKLDAGNGYRMDSFFDIWTEASLDGGQSWVPAIEGPVSSALHPQPPFAPYVITCPSNITVYATSPSGAVVNYSLVPLVIFPDCPFCCFTATCVPPSGSVFPIGTTTVNCVGHDGCGEQPTCSFTVTVIQPFIYAGLVDSVLGRAVLSTYDANTDHLGNFLVVSNLFSGGADGFHINLGLVDSLLVNFLPFPTTVNTCIVAMATGPYLADPNHLLGISTYFGGGNPLVRADFSSIGSTQVVVRVRDQNHRPILSAVVGNNQWIDVNALFPVECTNKTTVYTYWQGPDYAWYRFCKFGCDCIGTNCYVERIVCLAAEAPSPVKPCFLSGLDFRSQGLDVPSSLTIRSQDIGVFRNLHRVTGDATFDARAGLLDLQSSLDGFLAVNNIGSSGEDGVAVNLNNAGKFDMTLAPTRLLSPGACWHMRAVGDWNGVPAVQLADASFMNIGGPAGGGLQVNGDFRAIGATMVEVEIYQGSQRTGSFTAPAGVLGTLTINGNLIGCGTLPQPMPGLWARFDSMFSFMATDGKNFSGDEIRIRAANPNGAVRGLSQFSVQACNLGPFAILGERVTPRLGSLTRVSGGGIFVSGQGVPGTRYRLEAAPSLGAQMDWKTVDSAEADLEGMFELSDLPTAQQQFYRAVTP